jgi:hypothetical protein
MDCWQEMMDEASATDFRDLTIKTTCCHTLTDLNALKYQADCGFAKSVITVIDPDTTGIDSKLLPELKKSAGLILGSFTHIFDNSKHILPFI